jgi:hypothetical protein
MHTASDRGEVLPLTDDPPSAMMLAVRYALRLTSASILFALGFAAGGAGAAAGSKSSASCPGCVARPALSPSEARAGAAQVRSNWLREINRRGKRGRANPHPVRFHNPSRATFLSKLRMASRRYNFKVLRVHFYKPLQLAPLVILRSRRPMQFRDATPAIQHSLDAHLGRDDRKGWVWEGFYLEARDARGIPFLAIDNFWRGAHAGGGEWARSEALYPFAHL